MGCALKGTLAAVWRTHWRKCGYSQASWEAPVVLQKDENGAFNQSDPSGDRWK